MSLSLLWLVLQRASQPRLDLPPKMCHPDIPQSRDTGSGVRGHICLGGVQPPHPTQGVTISPAPGMGHEAPSLGARGVSASLPSTELFLPPLQKEGVCTVTSSRDSLILLPIEAVVYYKELSIQHPKLTSHYIFTAF